MLNYYEINTGGNRDEKMTKRQKDNFLDKLNASYDAYTVQEILSKIKDKFKQNFEDTESNEESFDIPEEDDKEKHTPFPKDPNVNSGRRIGYNDPNFLGINPDIEMFISWLHSLLYSADHKVTVDQNKEGTITNINLEKIKKKGGKKK